MRGVRESEPVAEKRPAKAIRIGSEVIRPYTGKEDLPEEKLDAKGNIVKSGEPRHFLARAGNDYKLIRIYRAKGIKRSLVRMIKPNKRNKPQEKELLARLKEANIPGAI